MKHIVTKYIYLIGEISCYSKYIKFCYENVKSLSWFKYLTANSSDKSDAQHT